MDKDKKKVQNKKYTHKRAVLYMSPETKKEIKAEMDKRNSNLGTGRMYRETWMSIIDKIWTFYKTNFMGVE